MILEFLGTHNAESKNTRLVSFLIDGILAVEAGTLAAELSFTEQEKIKVILLTHGHYDHIRGVPAFAFNNSCRTTRVFANPETLEILATHLIDDKIYPRFSEKTDFLDKRALELLPLEPLKYRDIEGYRVLPIPVNHPIATMGFEISKDGKSLFYTGDTGPGLMSLWEHISPQLLIIDLTFPNSAEKASRDSGHLCPKLLKDELMGFYQAKGYLPRIVLIHLCPWFEGEIAQEVKQVAGELGITISIAREGEHLIL